MLFRDQRASKKLESMKFLVNRIREEKYIVEKVKNRNWNDPRCDLTCGIDGKNLKVQIYSGSHEKSYA